MFLPARMHVLLTATTLLTLGIDLFSGRPISISTLILASECSYLASFWPQDSVAFQIWEVPDTVVVSSRWIFDNYVKLALEIIFYKYVTEVDESACS